jgi:hypothetical protein
MTYSTRLVLFSTLFVALVGGLSQVCPGWLDPMDWAQRLQQEKQRYEILQDWDDHILQRIELKDRVIADLLEGRLTLLQAAAWFAHLNDGGPPQFRELGDLFFHGASRGERLCRQVIQWCVVELRDRPSCETGPILERLEEELRSHLEQHGTVELPGAEMPDPLAPGTSSPGVPSARRGAAAPQRLTGLGTGSVANGQSVG